MTTDPNIPDKADPDSPLSQAERRTRMRQEWNDLIEDLISEGQDQGMFDNLSGKGKPLNLQKNLYAPELDLAHNLLKDNELAPAWILDRNSLLEQIHTIRTAIQNGWQRQRREFEFATSSTQRDRISNRWYDTCQTWDTEIGDLNKKINTYNLKRPLENLEIFKLDLEKELTRIGATRWLRS
ncbi:MAG: DUF1992 domain-containing protein [Chloroflexota bacterium]